MDYLNDIYKKQLNKDCEDYPEFHKNFRKNMYNLQKLQFPLENICAVCYIDSRN